MLEIELYKNNNLNSAGYGLYYGRVDTKEIMDVDALADHMSHHNTPFSKGSIIGILKDMVSCIRELNLSGQPVKIDGLAIFSTHIENKGGWATLADVNLSMGGERDNIQALRLCAQATGEFTKAELTKYGTVALNRNWREQVQAAKKAAGLDPDPEPTPSNGGDNQGGNTPGGDQSGDDD